MLLVGPRLEIQLLESLGELSTRRCCNISSITTPSTLAKALSVRRGSVGPRVPSLARGLLGNAVTKFNSQEQVKERERGLSSMRHLARPPLPMFRKVCQKDES